MTPVHNSLEPFIRGLLNALKADVSRIHIAHSKEIQRDFDRILHRLDCEGLPFVTSTLPSLGSAILQSFRTKRLETPQGFRRKKGTTLPRLLSGLLVQGYDKCGRLRDDCSPQVVKHLLQICFLFYKLELPFTEQQIARKVEGFLQCEVDLRALTLDAGDVILRVAQDLITELFREFNPREITPKHGPGALATGEKDERKWRFLRKYKELHSFFPYYEYFVPSRASLLRRIRWYKRLIPCEKPRSAIRFVPKDSRGPRIISMEALEVQFAQQGLKTALYDHIERHPLTKGLVNFTKQSINQQLAVEGSRDNTWATLDMKEASDRVSLQLVRVLFARTSLLPALEAVRSHFAVFPKGIHDGKEVELYKYAPMGSAVCFPVEAVTFWALSKAIMAYELGIVNFPEETPAAYVYGDDIIIDRVFANAIMEALPKYGLLVNKNKSFTDGPFRESCGFDCFKGEVVTPLKIRKPLCKKTKSAWSQLLNSYSDYIYDLENRGYYEASEFLKTHPLLQKIPRLPWKSRSGIGIVAEDSRPTVRWNEDLQRREYKGLDVVGRKRLAIWPGEQVLFPSLMGINTEMMEVPHASNTKLRWFVVDEPALERPWDFPCGRYMHEVGTDIVWNDLEHRARFADYKRRAV